jgi:hypothetical protein
MDGLGTALEKYDGRFIGPRSAARRMARFARTALFTLPIAFALGWLISPERIALERDHFAAIIHVGDVTPLDLR